MNCRVGGYDQGFHEIHQISPWNLADLTCKIWWISPRYHLWNPPKIIKASVLGKTLQFDECRGGGFHPRNLVDFNHEIWWISPRFDLWNPPKLIKTSVSAKTLQFDECRVGDFTLEIHWISPWNLVDFTCEIWWISQVKSGWGFHPGNPVDFTHEIWWISPRFHLWNPPKIIKASVLAKTLQFDECRVGDFTLEIPPDFTLKSGGFDLWNLVDLTQIWPVKSTQNYKSKCFSKNSLVWWMQGGGFHPRNPMDFTHEIWQLSPRFHLWNPPKIIKASVLAKTL